MAQIDLNDVIRRAVSEEVQRVLAPHLELLERLSVAFGTGAPRRAAPPRAPVARPAVRRRAAPSVGRGNAADFKEGQTVRYKQGRGEFSATIERINLDTNTLALRREVDGKMIDRPASKVYAA